MAPRAPRARRTRYATSRTLTLKIRLHPEELARVRCFAETLSMPTSTFVRDAAVGYRLHSRADLEVIRHLERIGNLLNQLTRLAHTAGSPEKLLRAQAVSAVRRLGWRAVAGLVPGPAFNGLRVTVALAKGPARVITRGMELRIGR